MAIPHNPNALAELEKLGRDLAAIPVPEVRGIVAAALYDFLGHLTTRDDGFMIGSAHTVHRPLDELEAFAKSRGINTKDADGRISNWSASLNP